jgi:toxin ParE1/3/4
VNPATPELSGRGRRDLDEIRNWTIETWGTARWQAYYRGIGSCLRRIASDPTCGRPQDRLARGTRSLTYERHLIFFAPVVSHGGQPVVLRILHQRRNLEAMTYFDRL